MLGLALGDDGLRRRPFGLPLDDQRPCGVHADGGPLRLRLGLPAAGLEFGRIHAGKDIARLHEIALVDEDFADAPRRFRRDVDIDRLDAPVPACKPFRQGSVSGLPPSIDPAGGKHRQQDQSQAEATACHHHPATPSIRLQSSRHRLAGT